MSGLTDLLRDLAHDDQAQQEANLVVGWDSGPEQGAWLQALADALDSRRPSHHYRGVPGCRLSLADATESPNCWCPRDRRREEWRP